MLRLYVLDGPAVGRSFPVGEGAVLGRGDDCDVVLPDGSVSRRHAELVRADGGWVLQDLGSSNGIEKDGRRARRCRIDDGTEVTLGRVTVRFREAEAATTSPPPKPKEPTDRTAVKLESVEPIELEEASPAAPSSPGVSESRTRAADPAPRSGGRSQAPGSTSRAPGSRSQAPGATPRGRGERRDELLREMQHEDVGLFGGDLSQWSGWLRWTVYLLALAVAAGAAWGAFRAATLLRGG